MHIAWFNGDTYVGGKSMSYGLKGDHGWTRMSLTAEVPAGTDKIGVYFDMNSATGAVWFDAMQLEEGASANDVNLVDDSDMNLPSAWMTSNARDFSGGVCRFTPNIDASVNNGYVHQTIQVNAADVCFNVYGTASADSTSLLHNGRAFSMELAIEYADGQGEWQSQPFNEAVNDQQHMILVSIIFYHLTKKQQ